MVDLVSLKDFLVLCQTKSFSRAAGRCHVSVSGLSRRIQCLEHWIGAPVVDRGKPSLTLTDAGRRLQAVASEVVYALEGLRKSVREDGEDRQARIRFSAPHIMSAVFFPEWIPRLHGDFRTAKFSVESGNLPECLAMLDEGSADFVVAMFDAGQAVAGRLGLAADCAGHLCLELGQDRLVPVCSPNAAGRPLYDLSGSRQESVSFLGYAPECHLGWSLQPLLESLDGVRLDQIHSASLTDGLRSMALSRMGIAWLPYTLVREDFAAKRLVRAGDARFDVPLRLTILRRPATLAEQAERLWAFLAGLCAQAPARPARPLHAVATR